MSFFASVYRNLQFQFSAILGNVKNFFQLNLYAQSCLTLGLPEAKKKATQTKNTKIEILKMVFKLKVNL